MDVVEARKILGKSATSLTDDQVKDIIAMTDSLTSSWLDDYEKSIFNGQTLSEIFPQMNIYQEFETDNQKSKRKR
jgi:hypothetical protein